MLRHSLLAVAALLTAPAIFAATEITNPRCEYLTQPICVDATHPRLTWELESDTPVDNIRVELSDAKGNRVWRSKALAPDTRSIVIPKGVKSQSAYRWTVTANDKKGAALASSTSSFETAKFGANDWKASWITDSNDKETEAAPMFRKTFTIDNTPSTGRAYISAAGYYVLYVNGQRVGDSHMDPGFTHYDKRNLYATHDITPLLRKGENVVTAVLGNGFYNCQSKAVWDFEKARWRERPSFICEIITTDRNGNRRTVAATDSTWLTATGPYTYNNIYSGDRYDARIGGNDWTTLSFDDSAWLQAKPASAPSAMLKAQSTPPIRTTERIRPTLVHNWGDTIYVFDMGKNIAGVTEINIQGPRGTHLKLSHGELLKNDLRLQQGNIDVYYHPEKPGEQFQTDEFTLAGTGQPESFKPDFTYHGFRYVEVRADRPISITPDNLTGHFIHTDLQPVGSFTSSNPLLNKIYDATMLSYLSNIHSIPTDCPQREKNGWTADAHAAIDLALLNYDGITLYEKWLADFADNQLPSGNVAGIIPSAGWGYGAWPGPVWDAAMFIIPKAVHDYYGDTRIIESIYPTLEHYFDWCRSLETEDGTLTNGIGDWVYYRAQTPTDYTSTLYYYLDNRMMSEFATLIGRDATPYDKKASALRNILNNKYFNADSATYANGTQSALALALYAGIVPPEHEAAVAARLQKTVAANNHALDFGLLGSKTVLRMLTKYGYVDDAYAMATRTTPPSWGFWIDKMGYSTLPETWTLSPEFNDASINHVFLGDISAWMTNDLAGINHDPLSPGFKNVIIRPHFPAGLYSAQATYHSVRGEIASAWQRNGSNITLTVTIPTGATATVITDKENTVGPGTHTFTFSE